jgi:hypothetical protein
MTAPTSRAGTEPVPESMEPGHILIQIHKPREDGCGRVAFFAFWHDPGAPQRGAPHEVAGQVFHASLAEFVAREMARGYRLTIEGRVIPNPDAPGRSATRRCLCPGP